MLISGVYTCPDVSETILYPLEHFFKTELCEQIITDGSSNKDYYYKRNNYGMYGSFGSLPPAPPPLNIKNPTKILTAKYLDNR